MRLSTPRVFAILALGSCALAGDARGQGISTARTNAEREFMNWNSAHPPVTVDGYNMALYCFVANNVAKVIAEKAGDDASSHRYELGTEKSWIFARRVEEQLGLIESNHGASDSAEIRTLARDKDALDAAIGRCRGAGLVLDDVDPSPPSETAGPNRDNTESAIDQKFARWSNNWAVDQYLPGTARIDNMQCGTQGCEAVGHFSFSRGGAVLTIRFTAQIPSVGRNEYALGRLCYNDNTTGMSDCVD